MKWREEVFKAFEDVQLDYFSMAAYDLMEYVRYEFSAEMSDQIHAMIRSLEMSYPRKEIVRGYNGYCRADNFDKVPVSRFTIEKCDEVKKIFRLADGINLKLPSGIRGSWRWRILYLRCLIDNELVNNEFEVNQTCEEAFRELTELYHAENADFILSPPTVESIAALRGIGGEHYYDDPV